MTEDALIGVGEEQPAPPRQPLDQVSEGDALNNRPFASFKVTFPDGTEAIPASVTPTVPGKWSAFVLKPSGWESKSDLSGCTIELCNFYYNGRDHVPNALVSTKGLI